MDQVGPVAPVEGSELGDYCLQVQWVAAVDQGQGGPED